MMSLIYDEERNIYKLKLTDNSLAYSHHILCNFEFDSYCNVCGKDNCTLFSVDTSEYEYGACNFCLTCLQKIADIGEHLNKSLNFRKNHLLSTFPTYEEKE